jgi:hypothetical protein
MKSQGMGGGGVSMYEAVGIEGAKKKGIKDR